MDLIAGISRYPVQTAALTFTSATIVAILLLAHEFVRCCSWLKVVISWYAATGIVILWLGLARNFGDGALADLPIEHLGLLNLFHMLTVGLWPLVLLLNTYSSGNDPPTVARMLQESTIAACFGLVVAVSVVAVLKRRDRPSAVSRKQT